MGGAEDVSLDAMIEGGTSIPSRVCKGEKGDSRSMALSNLFNNLILISTDFQGIMIVCIRPDYYIIFLTYPLMNHAVDTGSYILEETELEVDSDGDGEYHAVEKRKWQTVCDEVQQTWEPTNENF
jgi:hypothetical protein